MILKYYSEQERIWLLKQGFPKTILRYGGQGSGNFGHEGRLGIQGGSSPSGTTGHGVGARGIRSAGPGEYGAAGGGGGGSGGGNVYIPEPAELYAISVYCTEGHERINKNLREGKVLPKDKYTIKALDSLIQKSAKVEKPLYRGVDAPTKVQFRPGMILSDDAYASFSERSKMALKFAKGKYPVLFTCPQGGAASIANFSEFYDEREALFPRGQKFRVVKFAQIGNIDHVEIKPI